MRKIYYSVLVTIGLIAMSSCSQDDSVLQNEVSNQHEISTRSVAESLLPDSIIPLMVDSNLVKNNQTRANRAYVDYDENFSSNIWEIRELPITIEARGKGNTDNKHLRTNGKSQEVTMGTPGRRLDTSFWFYLKVLPASSGIPYLIYSYQEKTPLGVGQYSSNPNNKVLFTTPSESGSLYTASWDLLPSPTYKGYFAIQSESYLGQSDPNNMWSVFNYVVEAKNDNKVGYGQYTKKAQQEFMITPAKHFTLDYLEFYKDGSSVVKQEPLKTTTYGRNPTPERAPFTINAMHYAYDTSSFYENSALKISIKNTDQLFYRPTVDAVRFVPPLPVKPEDDPSPKREKPDMTYSFTTQQIYNVLKFDIDGYAKPNSLIEVTSYLECYRVSAKYTAHMSYIHNGELRKVKINGTWNGLIYTTKRDNRYPNDVVKCFDLDDGEELMSTKSIKISPTTIK